jgi:hypothetical protein
MPFLGGRGQSSRGYFGFASTPDAPTSLSSVAGNGQLIISFTPPAFNGGLEITNYEWSVNAGSTWTAVSPADAVSPVTIGPLSNGTPYTVYLRAVNALGGGAASLPVSTNTTPRTVPSAITNLSAARQASQTVRLSFTAPNNGGSGILRYEYRFKTTGSYGAWTTSGTTSGTTTITFDVGSLTNGTSYTFQVRAVNVAGEADASNEASATPFTTPSITLNAATNFNQNRATLNATLNSTGGDTTTVTFEYYKGSDSWTSVAATAGSGSTYYANITGLVENTTYTFRVKAANSAGTSTTGTSTFKTWQLLTLFSSSLNDSVNVPTITPTGGTKITPKIYEVVIFGGGGNSGFYGSAGGGAAYKTDSSVDVGSSGTVSWTIGGTGGGTTTITGLSVTYSAAGGANGSNDTPIGPSAFTGGDGWGAMTSGGSGASGNGNAAGAGLYYAEDKVESWVYGGGGGSAGAGGAASTSPQGGNGGDGNSFYGIAGGGGGGAGGGGAFSWSYGSNGSNRTYGGGARGYQDDATAGVVRFKYYGV